MALEDDVQTRTHIGSTHVDELSLRGKPIIGQLAHELIYYLADVKVGDDNK